MNVSQMSVSNKCKWHIEFKDVFIDKFNSTYVYFQNICNNLPDSQSSSFLTGCVDTFKCAGDVIRCRTSDPNCKHRNNPWWNGQCTLCKYYKLKALYQFRRSNSRADLIHYKIKRNTFKALCQQCKQIYCKSKRTELIDSRNDNKKYWPMLNNCNKV